ncbi:hypothetical protein IST455A_01004 [Burkholderia multivorans]|uniref:hypothetical protein n=1 Tax=Burkholderia multivorans TaxID=87883 RepID=UPI00123A2733|nr:hypothetical protein [Burkholderia multivorans]MBU9247624.1 hypothetical protein [Burkholderia multivorans]QET31721.1 hypothetical protein FOB31_18910 [Burkholderia multivorans]QET40859.1 hypothetical protein FOB30_24950 [Burkholderia multivorans]CAB5280133.1 hypothetical protein IST495A_03479 [Burkholderia multivorans]CAB5300678.1 hypothetical protein IST419_01131 [Burkholderia multivorans]
MKTIYLTVDGVGVKLRVGESSAVAEAQAGPFMRPVRVSSPHAGLLHGLDQPEKYSLTKSLVAEAVDRALGRSTTQRGAFDQLVDELHASRQRARQPLRKAIVFTHPVERRHGLASGQAAIFFREPA